MKLLFSKVQSIFLGSILILSNGVSYSNEYDPLRPFVSVKQIHEDNLFKSNDTTAKKDIISVLNVGVKGDIDVSRQKITLDALFTQSSYEYNDQLDNNSQSVNGNLLWVVGSDWNGVIGLGSKKSLNSFEDNPAIREKIFRTINSASFSANHKLLPRWTVGAGVSAYQLEYDSSILDSNNLDFISADLSLVHLTGKFNQIGLKYSLSSTKFPNREYIPGDFIDEGYNIHQLVVTGIWRVSGKNTLTGQVGWEALNNNNLDSRNYSGLYFNLSNIWRISGKTSVNTSLRRDVSPTSTIFATYQTNNVLSFSPNWKFSQKLTFFSNASFSSISLEGDPGFVSNSASVSEDYRSLSAGLNYRPTKSLVFNLQVNRNNRLSDNVGRDFEANTASISLKGTW